LTRKLFNVNLFVPQKSEGLPFSNAKSIFGSRRNIAKDKDKEKDRDEERKEERKEEKHKTLPIINPLVRLPSWPNVQSGAGFISKCLLANADTLCSLACPLMDPDETLLEGFYERSVMNNYFGIGIDAKISLGRLSIQLLSATLLPFITHL